MEAAALLEVSRRAERSLGSYVRAAWHVLEPETPFITGWHIDCIVEHLEAVSAGQIQRLLVNVPPRTTKSTLITICWPTWEWISKPHLRWMFASYSASLSTKHSVDRRRLIESDWYRSRWGDRYRLTTDQNVKTEYENTARGVMISTSVGGTAGGKGGDRLVSDDLVDPYEAASEARREAANEWFAKVYSTRLNDPRVGAQVVVMQRLHPHDLTGKLLEQGGWTYLCLPAEAPARTVVVFPRSRREVVREAGDLLEPQRFGRVQLDQLRSDLGSQAYQAQYQQEPTPPEGYLFKREWFGRYGPGPHEYSVIGQAWDTALEAKESADFSCCVTLGKEKVAGKIHVLDIWRGRVETPELAERMKALYERWKPRWVAVEKSSAGASAIQYIRREATLPLVPVVADRDKVARANGVTPICEAGNVLLPEAATWVTDFLDELCAFPNGQHDDQVDGFGYGLARLQRRGPLLTVG